MDAEDEKMIVMDFDTRDDSYKYEHNNAIDAVSSNGEDSSKIQRGIHVMALPCTSTVSRAEAAVRPSAFNGGLNMFVESPTSSPQPWLKY